MSGFALTIGTSAPEAARQFRRFLVEGIDDWTIPPPLGNPLGVNLQDIWARSRREMFRTRGTSEGIRRWEYTPQERRYVAFKSRVTDMPYRETRKEVLHWIGYNRLRESWSNPNSPDFVAQHGKQYTFLGSSLPWAVTNQTGNGYAPAFVGGYRIPARNQTAVGYKTAKQMERAVFEYIALRIADATERVNAKQALAMRNQWRQ